MPQVFLLTKVAVRFGINNFLSELIRMDKCTHLNDREIPDSSIILENYNPQLQGCA